MIKDYDAILVLGAGLKKSTYRRRVEKAVKLYKENPTTKVIFSGRFWGGLKVKPATTEAKLMSIYAQELGLPKKNIILEERSLNTTGNFYFTWKNVLLKNKFKRILVITHPDHFAKAKFMSDKVFGNKYKLDFVSDGPQKKSMSNLASEKRGHYSMKQVRDNFKGIKSAESKKVRALMKQLSWYKNYRDL